MVLPQGERATPLAFHYLEHLVWLNAIGPDKVGPDRDSNAATSAIAVDYWLSGEEKDLRSIFRRLAHVFRPLTLSRDVAGNEREILLREYEERVVGHPLVRAALAMDAFLYAGNRLALSPAGSPEAIRVLEFEQARLLHKATHQPGSAMVLVIGNVRKKQILQAMEEAGWPRGKGEGPAPAPPRFHLAEPVTKVFHFTDPHVQPRLIWRRVVQLPAPVDFDLLEAEGALLSAIFDTDLRGGLAGPLRYDAAIAESFAIAVRPIDERHVELVFDAVPETRVSTRRLRGTFERELARIAREGIPEATYRRVFRRFGYWPEWDDEQEVKRWLAAYSLDRVFALRRPLSREAIRKMRDRLSRRALNDLLRRLVHKGRTAVAHVEPSSEPESGENAR